MEGREAFTTTTTTTTTTTIIIISMYIRDCDILSESNETDSNFLPTVDVGG